MSWPASVNSLALRGGSVVVVVVVVVVDVDVVVVVEVEIVVVVGVVLVLLSEGSAVLCGEERRQAAMRVHWSERLWETGQAHARGCVFGRCAGQAGEKRRPELRAARTERERERQQTAAARRRRLIATQVDPVHRGRLSAKEVSGRECSRRRRGRGKKRETEREGKKKQGRGKEGTGKKTTRPILLPLSSVALPHCRQRLCQRHLHAYFNVKRPGMAAARHGKERKRAKKNTASNRKGVSD